MSIKKVLKKSSTLVRAAKWWKQTKAYKNWHAKQDQQHYEKKSVLWEKEAPGLLIIENTSFCNAQCIMCPNPTMVRKKNTMDFELYKKIIDEYDAMGGGNIQMNGTGEPLIDKGLEEKVEYAKSKPNINEVVFFNNGSLMSGKRAEKLLDLKPTRISFSIDGVEKAGYEGVRVGLEWETVYGNIATFLKNWNKAGRPFEVRIQSMVTVSLEMAYKSEAYKFWVSQGADVRIGSLKDAHDWGGQVKIDNTAHKKRAREIPRLPCRRLWSSMSILSNGQVALCCIDSEGKKPFGDLNVQSLEEIWYGEKLAEARQFLRDGKPGKVHMCGPCTERPSWLRPKGE